MIRVRTAEQRAADDELTAAVEKVARLYDVGDDDELVMDFVICGFLRSPDTVAEGKSRFILLYKDNGEAGNTYQQEGMLREALRGHIASSVIGDE